MPGFNIISPMLTFYHRPEDISDMVKAQRSKALITIGIEAKEYRR
jgi:4-hydroxy-3-polyprenylbenzoate decarboxylase